MGERPSARRATRWKAFIVNWFAQQRQEWIGETLRVFGFINRVHIERKFGVSTPQASMDLRTFQAAKGTCIYDHQAKQYVALWTLAKPSGNRP